MYNLLNKSLNPCNQMVKNLIVIEDAYINTYHPDFMGGANAIFNVFDPQQYQAQQAKLSKIEADRKRNRDELAFEEISENTLNNNQMTNKPANKQSAQGGSGGGGLLSSFFGGSYQQPESEAEEQNTGRL